MALPSRLSDTTQAHIEALIQERAQEGAHLEFKREFPVNWDNGTKLEVLADISAFANAGGGELVYGIAENENAQAEAIVPQQFASAEQEVRRLQDFLMNLVDPRIPGVQIQAVEVTVAEAAGYAIVIRVPQSWVGPHRVNVNQHFFVREGLRKRQLNVPEIRSLFLRSESQGQRVRDFRTERLGSLLAGETPFRLRGDAVFVVHLVPVKAALGAGAGVNPAEYVGYGFRRTIPVIASGAAAEALVNLDGVAGARPVNEGRTHGYTVFFRNGFIESTNVMRATVAGEQASVLAGSIFEDHVVQFIESTRPELEHWGVDGPLIVMLSIVGGKGAKLAVHPQHGESGRFDRDVLALPDIELAGERDIRLELKPLFDLVWQSAGIHRSPHYNQQGRWARQQW
jgi:hypothetical protein